MLNEKDIQLMVGLLNKQEYKDVALRMFAVSLLGSTTITAPEIQKCLILLENYLNYVAPDNTKVKKINPAE